MELKLNTPSEKFEFLKNLFCGKSQQEITLTLSDAITTMRVITSHSEDGEFLFLATLSSCIKVGCGSVFTEAKKTAVTELIPVRLRDILKDTINEFFSPADESDYDLIRDLMAASDFFATQMLKLIFAVAYVGDMTDNTVIQKALEILVASGIDPDIEYEVDEYENSLEWDE